MATHINHDFNPRPQFVHQELTRIEGQPSRYTLNIAYKQIKSNLRKINSPAGCGTRGHLRLMCTLPEYNALPGSLATPWVDPIHPGATPNIPIGAGTAQINRIIAQYTNDRNQHTIQANIDKACLQLLMNAVDDTFYNILEDPQDGYADIHLIDLKTHLDITCGEVTPDDLDKNEAAIKKKWSPTQPLENLWKQCREGQAFAANHDPITDNRLIRYATENLENSGVFADGLKNWRKKAPADKTWNNLVTHFTLANKERLRSKTTGEFAATMKEAEQTMHTAETILAAILSGNNQHPALKNHPLLSKENLPTPMFYCWTHGLGHNPDHTGYTCKFPQQGHKKEATQFNMMGGCNIIHRIKDEKRVWVPR